MSETWLGSGNTIGHYALVLLVYAALFVVMRYANPRVAPEFRRAFWILYALWSFGTFLGNFVLYRIGWMSFLPWLNNAFHTFLWIGLCLGFLYAGSRRKPWLEQFALFAIFSFIVKEAEHGILGTWELDHFFVIRGQFAYRIGWSLMDGLYPFLSRAALRGIGKVIPGVAVP
ncbi:MAG: hypothetical protein LC796_16585 [Acidobacteria bacterium]|nr:hypothetical protein [Acidobacteriota bacterium]MCA1610127.1 hypothetical protein [Acidobacteriota bacterium]